VRLSWEGRHGDVTRSGSRGARPPAGAQGRGGTGGGRTSVRSMRGRCHTSPLSVTKMSGTPDFRAPSVCFRAPDRGPRSRCMYLGPHRGPETRSASVTVGRHARKRGVPTLFVTRSHPGRNPAILPCASRGAPVPLPRGSRRPLPAPPAVSATATACPGRGRDGPSLGRPGASFRGLDPSGRQLEEVPELARAPAWRGPGPSRAPALRGLGACPAPGRGPDPPPAPASRGSVPPRTPGSERPSLPGRRPLPDPRSPAVPRNAPPGLERIGGREKKPCPYRNTSLSLCSAGLDWKNCVCYECHPVGGSTDREAGFTQTGKPPWGGKGGPGAEQGSRSSRPDPHGADAQSAPPRLTFFSSRDRGPRDEKYARTERRRRAVSRPWVSRP
jgi:hypothetical protein